LTSREPPIWRRREAEDYPEDDRNREAAELLDRLGGEIGPYTGTTLQVGIERAFEIDPLSFSERVNEELRSVGFRSRPSSGRELLEQIASAIDA
jgi:hypothetical protein